jgi:hypothetical protein
MTFSLSIYPGVIYDARYVIMFFGLIFGGLQTGIILLIEFVVSVLFGGIWKMGRNDQCRVYFSCIDNFL